MISVTRNLGVVILVASLAYAAADGTISGTVEDPQDAAPGGLSCFQPNLAEALYTDGIRCTLTVDREVKTEIPARFHRQV